MPIRGVTDNVTASFPQIGTLRKGAARTQEDLQRNRPGRDLDGFRFTSDYPAVQKAFFDTYGPEPRLIDVYLLHPTADESLSSWQELWVAGGLRHRCDGVTCSVWLKPDGTYSTEPKPCPGPTEKRTAAGKTMIETCKPITRLKVFLRDLRRAGYVLVQTTSIHDAIALTEQLAAIEQETRGNLQGVPMVLSRHPHKISMPGANGQRNRVAKSLLSLEISPTWIDLRMAELEAGQVPVVPQLAAPTTVAVEHTPSDFGPPPDDEDDDADEGEFIDPSERPEHVDPHGEIHDDPKEGASTSNEGAAGVSNDAPASAAATGLSEESRDQYTAMLGRASQAGIDTAKWMIDYDTTAKQDAARKYQELRRLVEAAEAKKSEAA